MAFIITHFCRFGEFTVDNEQRVLLRAGRPVPLTPKVFDTLLVLVENSGRIVKKDELMNRLWPDSFVEEANLTSNVQQLRKALGDNARRPIYIETVARRGYRFIADVEEVPMDSGASGGQAAERFGPGSRRKQECVPPEEETAKPSSGEGTEPRSEELAGQKGPAILSAGKSPVTSFVGAPSSLVGAPLSRRTQRFLLFAAACSVALTGGIAYWSLLNRSKQEPGKANNSTPSPIRVERLTGTGQTDRVAISNDGRYVAYTRGDNSQSIWLRQLSTGSSVEIVPAGSRILALAFANSGEYVYFVRADPDALYRTPLLGGVATKVIDGPRGKFSLSPDDRQVAFVRRATNGDGLYTFSLVIANAERGTERTLLAGSPEYLDAPLWSPDALSIVCARGNWANGGQDVLIIEVRVNDGTKEELCPRRFNKVAKMAWLRGKSGLILSASVSVTYPVQLWRLSLPSRQLTQITEGLTSYADLNLTADGEAAVASQVTRISDLCVGSNREPQSLRRLTQALDNFCWTPDGLLVYSSLASGSTDIWTIQPDGTQQRQLTYNTGTNGTPAVTGDGRYIVFMSNRTGVFQVWRMNRDGSNQVQLTSGEGANFPSVSADGRWVIYNDTDTWRLWKISIDGGEPTRITDYPAEYPSISPNGDAIACIGISQAAKVLLVTPFEGGPALKSFDIVGSGPCVDRMQWTPDDKGVIYAARSGGVAQLFKQSLAGGPPERIVSFDDDNNLFDFGYSPGGRRLAATRGRWQHDVVLISGFNRF
jgi:Tol biopolymer transport system component/DNA-binding winged helix-turn-helix (wHTH) protein